MAHYRPHPLRHRFSFAALVAALVVALAGGHAAAQPTRPTWRARVDSARTQGDGQSVLPALSADGRFVAFESWATNLVPDDTNGSWDVFVHDTGTWTTSRISVDSAGGEANGNSHVPALSADARFVAFTSWATNLVPGDTNDLADVFVHDRATGTIARVNVDSAGAQAIGGHSGISVISADGLFVAFESSASNLVPGDTNGQTDVFVHDRTTGATSRVSVDSAGAQADDRSNDPTISADGRFVAFESWATNLVSGDTNGLADVFVHDTATGTTSRVSLDSAGAEADGISDDPAISGGGRFVTFSSWGTNLVPGDTGGRRDVFVHDTAAGTTDRVSVDSAGAEANGNSYGPAMSSDGRFVAFTSEAGNLVPGDTGWGDVFVHDTANGTTDRVSVDSAGGQPDFFSLSPTLSADGRFVVFSSWATNLVPGDTNGGPDVFVRDRIALDYNGVPQAGTPTHFAVSNAFGEAGNTALVLLSCSGTSPSPLPGRTDWPVYLTFDVCTSAGLAAGSLLRGTVQADGTAQTPQVPFPSVSPGLTIYAAAVTIGGGGFVAVTSPISIVTQ